MKDNRTDKEIGFVEGLWYVIEQLIVNGQVSLANQLVYDSNLPEWEFRKVLKETEYLTKELTEFLDEVFIKEK